MLTLASPSFEKKAVHTGEPIIRRAKTRQFFRVRKKLLSIILILINKPFQVK
jgi:hypothetical protein